MSRTTIDAGLLATAATLSLLPGSVRATGFGLTIGDIAQDAVLPAGHFVCSLTPDLKLGLSGNGPWGLVTAYPCDWVGRCRGVPSDRRTDDFTPAVSCRLDPTLILAAGLQIQYAKANLSGGTDAGLVLGRPGAFDVPSNVKGGDLSGRCENRVDMGGVQARLTF